MFILLITVSNFEWWAVSILNRMTWTHGWRLWRIVTFFNKICNRWLWIKRESKDTDLRDTEPDKILYFRVLMKTLPCVVMLSFNTKSQTWRNRPWMPQAWLGNTEHCLGHAHFINSKYFEETCLRQKMFDLEVVTKVWSVMAPYLLRLPLTN